MEDIDNLPAEPQMHKYKVSFGGQDNVQEVGFRSKNILEVLQQLVGDPCFKHEIDYVPRKYYTDKSRKVRVYREASSGNWWWRMQV
jgi:hypothetical protein